MSAVAVEPIIVNVVCTFNVGTNGDLKKLAATTAGASGNVRQRQQSIDKSKFRHLVLRLPEATLLVYASGNVVCTGAKTLEGANEAARRVLCILRRSGADTKTAAVDVSVQNLVASWAAGFDVDLARLAGLDRTRALWEPELFCGLKFRLCDGVVALVFSSGKVVFTGAKHPANVTNACSMLAPFLDKSKLCRQ